jgi:hypothetical protein
MAWYDNSTKWNYYILDYNITYINNSNESLSNVWSVPIFLYDNEDHDNLPMLAHFVTVYITDGNPNYPDGTIFTNSSDEILKREN